MKLFIRYTTLIIYLLLTSYKYTFSQVLSIKETYDLLNEETYNLNLNKFIDSIVFKFPINNGDSVSIYDALLGDRFAHVFASFLTMYKTTGDKGYLHKFISQTYFVQQFRNDKQIGGVKKS